MVGGKWAREFVERLWRIHSCLVREKGSGIGSSEGSNP